MKVKCYSVKIQLKSISDKCYKAISYNGKEDLLPKSQVFGLDYEKCKGDLSEDDSVKAYWISEWILEKKNIQCSKKRVAWVDTETEKVSIVPRITIQRHVPEIILPIEINVDIELSK